MITFMYPCDSCGHDTSIYRLAPISIFDTSFLVCEYCRQEQIVPLHNGETLEEIESGLRWVNEILKAIPQE